MTIESIDIEALWVPRNEACRILGEGLGLGRPIDYTSVMTLVREGQLQVKRMGAAGRGSGGRYFISLQSIRKFLENNH